MSSISPNSLRSPHNSGNRKLRYRNGKNSSSNSKRLRKKTTKVNNKEYEYMKPLVSFESNNTSSSNKKYEQLEASKELQKINYSKCSLSSNIGSNNDLKRKLPSNQTNELNQGDFSDEEGFQSVKLQRCESYKAEIYRRQKNREQIPQGRQRQFSLNTSDDLADWEVGVPNAQDKLFSCNLTKAQQKKISPVCKKSIIKKNCVSTGILEYLREQYKREEDILDCFREIDNVPPKVEEDLSFLKTNHCEFLFKSLSIDEMIDLTCNSLTKDNLLARLKHYMIIKICNDFEVEEKAITQLEDNSFDNVKRIFTKLFSDLDSSL